MKAFIELEPLGHNSGYKKRSRVLILQGPIGPFFSKLQNAFDSAGFETKRVIFHGADALFSSHKNTFRFSGSLHSWENWLRDELVHNQPDAVILFGSSRPAHKIARQVAQEFEVDVLSLEEGYLRSGFITCELGGNNQYSKLRNWKPGTKISDTLKKEPLKIKSSFAKMCFWGASYYLWREFTARKEDKAFYHRVTNGAFYETYSWTMHMLRRFRDKFTERRVISELFHHKAGNYLFIPLQTPMDAQMLTASRGWNNEKLVLACLDALQSSNSKQNLVFKTHPLDQNAHKLIAFIRKQAQLLELSEKIIVLQSGKLGDLTQYSSGMIVINSTSGFSALHHNKPLLVVGDAVYRHESIATIAKNENAFSEFLLSRTTKDHSTILSFMEAVKATALVPGDFYAVSAQQDTARNIVNKVNQLISEKLALLETIK